MHPTDPGLRLAAQDHDGIVGEVLYGVLGAADAIADAEVQVEVMRAYNDWLSDFCGFAPDRLVGVACLPSANPEAAAAELRRVAARGQHAVELAMTHGLMPLWRSELAPVWAAAHDCDVIVHLHTIGPPIDTRWATTPREIAAWVGTFLTVFQLRMIERLAELIFGGVLHAYPGMRVVL